MKTIGIVGSEGKKFTKLGEKRARELIRQLVEPFDAVCSGECHLGGIDIWAKEEAIKAGKKFIPCEPGVLTWSDSKNRKGFMSRNIDIAAISDQTTCITVDSLPPGFKEGGWEKFCYHCNSKDHIKSGGCWTTKYARKLGKIGNTLVISNV